MTRNEIILYQPDDAVKLEVRLSEETVWLTQQQMTVLFETTKQNISLHINNIFREKELDKNSVVKDYLTTAADGKKYRTQYYNLDVIISVGYRVKSQRGTQFRIWATGILKDYLLRGYALNNRLANIEGQLELNVALAQHNNQYEPIDLSIFTKSHDRFLIIDNDVYHIGASIKDLGKRWFAFCKMQLQADEMITKLI